MSKNNNKKKNIPEEEIEILQFMDEDGNIIKFEILDYVEFEGNDYAILLPENDTDGLVHIYEVVEELDSDEDTYIGLDDQDLVDKVYNVFIEKHKDDFNFVD